MVVGLSIEALVISIGFFCYVLAFFPGWLALRTLTVWGFGMNFKMETNSSTIWRVSEAKALS